MWRRILRRLFATQDFVADAESRGTCDDTLSGLSTRDALAERMRAARADAERGALVLLDVDLFKAFNARHGRAVGDALLVALARRLLADLPPQARLARLGGDQFLLMLPGADAAPALRLVRASMDKLREPIALGDGATEIVTLSAGVASFGGQSFDEALRCCDAALSAAKARGRDRVVLFDDDTRQLAAARQDGGATVVELQARKRALREQARIDALTGLRNRLALDEVLEIVVGADDRRLQSASVAFVDVDHFGNYNHVHGDACGDDALRRVASEIKACAHHGDFAFRRGGAEFVVVLPVGERDVAAAAAERIRAAVEELALPHSASAVAAVVTVTVGVAVGEAGFSVRQLLGAAAEQAMAAKVRGRRNSVHVIRVGLGGAARPARVDALAAAMPRPHPPAAPSAHRAS